MPGCSQTLTSPTVLPPRHASHHAFARSSMKSIAAALLALAALAPSASAATTTTLTAAADAYTTSAYPSTNYGTKGDLKTDNSPATTTWVRFNIPASHPPITSAKLRVWATVSSKTPVQVNPVSSTSWSEKGITYSTRPAMGTTSLGQSGTFSRRTWVTVNVTQPAYGSAVSYGLTTKTTSGFAFSAREAGSTRTPQLVLTMADPDAGARAGSRAGARSGPGPRAGPGSNVAPTASFTSSPSAPTAGQAVTFADASSDSDGSIAARAWDLDNDGAYDDATGSTAGRTFSAAGTYTVGLRVTDNAGATATAANTVTVGAALPVPTTFDAVRPYDPASPWNTPIAAGTSIDPKSAMWVNAIADNNLPLTSDPDQYTIPLYFYNATTPAATGIVTQRGPSATSPVRIAPREATTRTSASARSVTGTPHKRS